MSDSDVSTDEMKKFKYTPIKHIAYLYAQQNVEHYLRMKALNYFLENKDILEKRFTDVTLCKYPNYDKIAHECLKCVSQN